MSRNDPMSEHGPLFLMAGLACLLSMPILYLATRPVVWLHAAWTGWLLFALFTLLPPALAFIIVYCSAWHREWPRTRRIFSSILSSCLIFGVDLLLMAAFVIVVSLIAGLSHKMGGN